MYKLVFVSILLISFSAISEESKDDPVANQLQRILEHQLVMKAEAMNDPRIIEAKAKFARNLFDALLKNGFTEEQALILVSGSLSAKE